MEEIDKSQINVTSNKALRIFLISVGWISVVLGIIGIFLPVMPTTVFLLIAAACFARSSEKFYIWLLTNKHLGKFVLNYREKRGMTLKSKIIAITTLTIVLGYTIFFAVEPIWLKTILALIFIGVSSYILSLNTVE